MKILAVTGNRADYDLMSYLYRKLNQDREIELKLLVTGAHLNIGYRDSMNAIKQDGNDILACIENILNADTIKSRAKSMSILMSSFVDFTDVYSPDLIILAGDREEVPVVALTAAYLKIPCMHFFGGDYVSDGHVDNLARNVASKLATVHVVTLEEHKKRLIAMGEAAERIHVIGNIALDKFREERYIAKDQLMKQLNCEHIKEYALVIYHPPTDITGENHEIQNILRALKVKGISAFISYPNTDFNNSSVIKEFEPYLNDRSFYFYKNLDRNTFINLYKNALFQIGNSSAGITESASIPLPVINVGSRQKDRAAQENVIFVSGQYENISVTIDLVRSKKFLKSISGIKNQYGDGYSTELAYKLIKTIDFNKLLLKKDDPLGGKNERSNNITTLG